MYTTTPLNIIGFVSAPHQKMKSAAMSSNVLKRENASASANVLMCKQWWKVCWMYGDQEKYYRQLYAKRAVNLKVAGESEQQQNSSNYENAEIGVRQTNGSTPDVTNATSTMLSSLDLTNGIDE